ncbi:MAG TPA: hypothetical protein VJA66_10580, partial [Thermoanaerobaculia bacterium]
MSAEVQTEPVFKVGPLRVLFEVPYDRGTIPLRNFDVTRDGQTFVFVTGTSGREWRQVNVALGWTAGLLQLAAPTAR